MEDAIAEQLTSRQRAVWDAGDWPGFAPRIQEVADLTVESIDVGEGESYLDVATGSGNAAEAAARRGARVTGLDLVPKLVDAARARFESAGLEGEFVVGDAERLPFDDDSFDKVSSIFGVMFAPRQEAAAAELVRVARPGAVIGVAAWTPTGAVGEMFKRLARHMPPPPEEFVPAVMWGDEDHVRGLFAGTGAELAFEKRMAKFDFDSAEQWMDFTEQNLGPVVVAKAILEPQGKWDAAQADLVELQEETNEAEDGSLRSQGEYLLTIARA
ncbi:MAG TPA: methyltransferase domain-containing protein [Solirubrobacterales bacterium]|jgi:SAM-dependent methyltransferase